MSDQTAQSRLLVLLATISTVVGLYLLQPIAVPLAVAILVAFLLAPTVSRIQRWGVPRIPAVLLVVGCVFLAVALIGGVAVKQLVDLASNFSDYRSRVEYRLRAVKETAGGAVQRMNRAVENLKNNLETPETDGGTTVNEPDANPEGSGTNGTAVPVRVIDSGSSTLEFLGNWFGPLVSPLATAGAVTIFAIFMLIERRTLRDRLLLLVGNGRLYDTTRAIEEASHRVSRYIRAQAIINCTCGVVVGAGLLLIGLPGALLWGLVAAFARYVPYVGPWTSALVPIALSFGTFDGWFQPLLTIALFVVLELIVNNVVEPWLYGSSAGVSPLGILVGAFFWTWMWGGLGLLLATPITVCLVVVGRHVPQLRWLDVLFGPPPEISPANRVYQRLLAYDIDEAENLADAFAAEHERISVYDEILLPVLRLAMSERNHEILDDERKSFIFEAIRQIMRDLDAATVISGEDGAPTEGIKNAAADAFREHLVIIPAATEADSLAGEMLADLWKRRGHTCEVLAVDALVGEQVDEVNRPEVSAICISAVPPRAQWAARYLCKRLRARFPTQSLVVGLWNADVPPNKKSKNFVSAGADEVCNSLQEAMTTLEPLATNRALWLSQMA